MSFNFWERYYTVNLLYFIVPFSEFTLKINYLPFSQYTVDFMHLGVTEHAPSNYENNSIENMRPLGVLFALSNHQEHFSIYPGLPHRDETEHS